MRLELRVQGIKSFYICISKQEHDVKFVCENGKNSLDRAKARAECG